MSGEDGGLLPAVRKHAVVDGEEVDIGLVGEVVGVNPGPCASCWTTAGSP